MGYTKTESFDLVTEEDLNLSEGSQGMIMYCEECREFFSQKACGGRSIFFFDCVYHPDDGNTVILESGQASYGRILKTRKCKSRPQRVCTLKRLEECIIHANTLPTTVPPLKV